MGTHLSGRTRTVEIHRIVDGGKSVEWIGNGRHFFKCSVDAVQLVLEGEPTDLYELYADVRQEELT